MSGINFNKKCKRTCPSSLQSLSENPFKLVCEYLDLKSLARLSRVCRAFSNPSLKEIRNATENICVQLSLSNAEGYRLVLLVQPPIEINSLTEKLKHIQAKEATIIEAIQKELPMPTEEAQRLVLLAQKKLESIDQKLDSAQIMVKVKEIQKEEKIKVIQDHFNLPKAEADRLFLLTQLGLESFEQKMNNVHIIEKVEHIQAEEAAIIAAMHEELLMPEEEVQRLVLLAQEKLQSFDQKFNVDLIDVKVAEILTNETEEVIEAILKKIPKKDSTKDEEQLKTQLRGLHLEDLKNLESHDPHSEVFTEFLADISAEISQEIASNSEELNFSNKGLTQGRLLKIFMILIERNKKDSLKKLYLSSNQLTALPHSIGLFVNVIHLALDKNALKELPYTIGRLVKLSHLNLNDNGLTKLTWYIHELAELKEFYVANNELTELSESIGALAELQCLDISENKIKRLPKNVCYLFQLKNIVTTGQILTDLKSLPEGCVVIERA